MEHTAVTLRLAICVHSMPPGNMQMQPLRFLQYCGSCNRALGLMQTSTFTRARALSAALNARERNQD
ncbi:hypothetical protein HU200_049958 [Digitaria exilis]|uniref:Uncharacterized protein n=1 Tax=Digitaria exilis TaxID=1010633 RepID=A0A835AT18_9POAL|nr:hypothetical protein HU200_049958 [Digitaria exilis]